MESSKLTDGILVSITPIYQRINSKPIEDRYQFNYDVHIDNLNSFPVKVVQRTTVTKNGHGERKQGVTEGIFGQQTIVMPGKTFSYRGGIMLDTALGKFRITYHFLNTQAEEVLVVQSPLVILESEIACN